MPVAALSADLATENDAARLARSGVPVKQVAHRRTVPSGGGDARRHLDGWLPDDTRLLFVENVGNLVCPASYDLGEALRVTLASVTEGEDKPLKYPTAFGLAHLVVITKTDIAEAVEFDEARVPRQRRAGQPGSRGDPDLGTPGQGVGALLDRAMAAADGAPVHAPVMARSRTPTHGHTHAHPEATGTMATPTRERSAGPAAVAADTPRRRGSPSGEWCRASASGPTCTASPPSSPWPGT